MSAGQGATGPPPGDRLGAELTRALRALVRTAHLLVCVDYDGTLAPIVDDPSAARPLPEAVAALRVLATLPNTTAAVVSGRALRDLAALSRLPSEVHLVGSHGSEFDVGFVDELTPERRELRERLRDVLAPMVASTPGALLEQKPASVAVHVRRSTAVAGRALLDRIAAGPGRWPGVHLMQGKAVLELSVTQTDKGAALERLRHLAAASATLFVGDDVTDERALARMAGDDVGVKVGAGETVAGFRIDGPADVALLLAFLAEERHRWFAGGAAPPIEDHALLSDRRTVALVDPHGQITWLCYPSPESPAVFAALLGDPDAGSFVVEPDGSSAVLAQTYLRDSLAVRTRWPGLSVIDYFDRGSDQFPDRPGTSTLLRVITGNVPALLAFRPRPEFGSVPIRLKAIGGGVAVIGGAEPMVLVSSGVQWIIDDDGDQPVARARVDPTGTEVVLELRLGTTVVEPHPHSQHERRDRALEEDRQWVRGLRLPAAHRDAVARSALTLRALTHRPTGAILAAATTSLPEWIGGIRNWDYRYCWIRDAAMTARALVDLGSLEEALGFLDWMEQLLADGREPIDLHPLYAVDGHALGPEAVIEAMPGYAGSRPVRVGNAAQGQVQLDVFGPLLDLLDEVTAAVPATERQMDLVRGVVAALAQRWSDPDHGIWEIRDHPRHHVHSRMMTWVAMDRAISIAARVGPVDPRWPALAERIAADIEQRGYDEQLHSYVSAYGRRDVDAAVLHALGMGYPAPADRLAGTIAAVEKYLRRGPTVFRYRSDDGLPGQEGGMNICTAWLVETYVRAGQIEEAEELFAALLDRAGMTGLIPEMVEPGGTWRGLGNHPQAYSHIGVIRCALALDGAVAPH